ncbi:MAG: amidohydrolase, partial [Desulfatiglandales bacterium]|nr:amidohydrolase [Desulfatiglandales bacterium]
AVAIKEGKFVGAGTDSEIEKLVGPNTEVIDLGGKTVIPGFIDGHAHMDREGLKFQFPSLTGKKSIKEILEVIESEVKKKKPGEWVVTMPFGDYPGYFGSETPEFLKEKKFPNRHDLDRASPNNPVYLRGIWYYWRKTLPIVSIANSYALKLAGITRDTVPPYEGVEIVKDDQTGEPTGVFLEWNQPDTVEFSLMKVVPRFTHEERVEGLKDSMQRYNAVGTTSMYEGHGISSETLRAYKALWERGDITVRSYLVISPAWDAAPDAEIGEVLRDWAAYAAGIGFGDNRLKVGGIWTAIGNPMPEKIRRKERPYTAWAGYGVDQSLPPERGSLYDLVLATARAGLRANGIVALPSLLASYLDALERTNEQIPITDKRFVLQHLGYVTESQQETIKRLGVVATIIPGSSLWMAGSEIIQEASEEKLNTFIPLKSFIEKGIPFVISTDNKPIEPLHAFWIAVARKERVTGKVIGPGQKISREEALRALTINGAYLTFEENIKGSIEPGKLADLVTLSDDILTCPEEEIEDIEVLTTMVGGKIVFRK